MLLVGRNNPDVHHRNHTLCTFFIHKRIIIFYNVVELWLLSFYCQTEADASHICISFLWKKASLAFIRTHG